MRKYIIVLLLCGVVTWDFYAQTPSNCTTPPLYTEADSLNYPWFGDNEMLYQTLEDNPQYLIDFESAARSVDNCADINGALAIPVNFIVWMNEGEDIPLEEDRFQMALDVVNEGFQSNGLNFRFYLYCAPQFIVNATNFIFYDYVHLAAIGLHPANNLNALNVHVFAGQATDQTFGGVYHGVADIIGLNRNRFNSETSANTLIHEIGHYFHLQHTHLFTETPGCCAAEPVRRDKFWHPPCIGCGEVDGWQIYNRKCARSGDWLCDTPADPEGEQIIFYDGSEVSECEAIPSPVFDQNGEAYVPDVYNYMSYFSRECRSRFSNGQKGIIINQFLSNPRRQFIKDVNINLSAAKPDQYEPDNSDANLMPSSIAVGDRQCHSMHNSLAQSSCGDTEDWLILDNINGMLEGYIIEINNVDGYNNPVDDIVIYNTNDQGERTNQIIPIFTDNGTSRSWRIPCEALSENTTTIADLYDYNDFLVQINRGNNAAGLYEVELKKVLQKMPRLNEANQVCIGSVFNVTTLEPGATVTWDSNNLLLSTNVGPSTTVVFADPLFDNFEIEAIIEFNGCTYRISREFDEVASATIANIGSITMDVVGNACEPQFTFSIPTALGVTYYEWGCTGTVGGEEEHFTGCFGEVVNESQSIAYTHASAYAENGESVIINVTVTVSNDCGVEATKSQGFLYRPEGDCDIQGPIRSVDITPNPVNDTYFTLSIDDDTVNPDPYQIVIFNQYGNISYMLQSPDKMHQMSTLSFPNGLYYAEVVSNTNLVSTAFFIQN